MHMARRHPGSRWRLPLLAVAAALIVLGGAALSGLPRESPAPGSPVGSDGASPAVSPSAATAAPVLPTIDPDRYWSGTWLPPDFRPSVARAGWLADQTELRAEPEAEAAVVDILPAGHGVTIQARQGSDSGWVAVVPVGAPADAVGWVPAAALTSRDPGRVSALTIDVLDPGLAAYLERWKDQAGVSVVDLTTGRTYGFNDEVHFITASSVKVPMMLTLLRQLEAAGRPPSASQIDLMTGMIERSDNAAASRINAQIGDRQGLIDFAVAFGLFGFRPGSTHDQGWGWGTITPAAMARLFVLFEQGAVLDVPADEALARELLGNVIRSQRVGVGSTAPTGARVLMKNGWVAGPDGRWVFNSSGIVTTATGSWAIAAYTAHNASLGEGQAIVINICRKVAAALS